MEQQQSVTQLTQEDKLMGFVGLTQQLLRNLTKKDTLKTEEIIRYLDSSLPFLIDLSENPQLLRRLFRSRIERDSLYPSLRLEESGLSLEQIMKNQKDELGRQLQEFRDELETQDLF